MAVARRTPAPLPFSRALLRSLLLALVLWLCPRAAHAYDPALGWHTIETPHFELHYHDGLAPLAQRAARAAEAAWARLVPALGHLPEGKVQLVLSDDTDSANGSATAFIRPTIHLFAVPPDDRSELNDYEDYLWNLFTHEFTHLLHLDEIGGVPAVVDAVFGQLWVPNGIQPGWFIEGLAINSESRLSGGGRNRSAIYDMYLRTEALEGGIPGIDDASNRPTTWPRGGLAYLHGARFLAWVEERYGADVFRQISQTYGAQLVPFGVNLVAQEVLGRTWIELYEQWRRDYEAQVQELVERLSGRGLTESQRLTFAGEQTGEPRFLPDGRILYVESSADSRAALRLIAGREDRLVRELHTSGSLAVAPDGRTAVVSQTLPHREYYWFEDLLRVDLASGKLERLTDGARATEPDVSPDGASVVFARRLTGGRVVLARVPLAGGRVETLYEPPHGGLVFTPRYSPDGRKIAFSEQRPAGRDIRVLDLQNGEVMTVTRDRALDLNPTFDPSGRWLLFASDRTGIYNLFAHDLQSGETLQVTNVLTGAFRPAVSPDGKTLAFVSYSAKGYDVSVTAFDPEKWRPAGPAQSERPAPPAWEGRELYPVKSYQPHQTLLPRWWLPLFESDLLGPSVAVVTSGSDTVGLHTWSLHGGWGLASQSPYLDLSYTTYAVRPELTVSAGTWLAAVPGAPDFLAERQWDAALTATWPFSGPDWSLALSLGYDLRYYAPDAVPLPLDPSEPVPFRPDRGLAATVSARASWSNAQRFANAISAERGFTLSLGARGARPETGSQFSYGAIDAAVTKYLRMPWLDHHALALRLAGGASVGDLGKRRVYGLGGPTFGDPILDLLYMRSTSSAALRGYAPGALAGSRYVLANAEYRFPMVTIDAGLWTLPVYLRRIHGALTFDAGWAGEQFALRELRPSAGAELRIEMLLGYELLTQLRIGYARGFGPEGIDNFFVTIGSGF